MSPKNVNLLNPLIIDIGTNTFRLGWAGDDFPDIIAPCVYVNLTDFLFTADVIDGLEDLFFPEQILSQNLFGYEALKYQNILKIHEFKKEGNYNILAKFFHYYYQKLKIPEEYKFKQPIIILTPLFMPELEKNKLKEIFFNEFMVPSLFFLPESQAILSTLQKTSGVIINIGESNTYISTIFHGFSNLMARDLFPVAGKDLTDYFLNMVLTKKSSKSAIYLDYWIAKEIKEKLSTCVLDPEEESRRIRDGLTIYNRSLTLPDGSNLEINLERFMLTEPLFNPNLIHIDYITLGEAVAKVIKTWERENWEELLSNIILSGGASLISGLDKRVALEISKFFSEKIQEKIKVLAPSGRENMAWIGASILYSQEKLKKGWQINPKLEISEKV
jgi:actin-related protein